MIVIILYDFISLNKYLLISKYNSSKYLCNNMKGLFLFNFDSIWNMQIILIQYFYLLYNKK